MAEDIGENKNENKNGVYIEINWLVRLFPKIFNREGNRGRQQE